MTHIAHLQAQVDRLENEYKSVKHLLSEDEIFEFKQKIQSLNKEIGLEVTL